MTEGDNKYKSGNRWNKTRQTIAKINKSNSCFSEKNKIKLLGGSKREKNSINCKGKKR